MASRLTDNTRYRQQNAVGIVGEYCLAEGSTGTAALRTRIMLPQGVQTNMPSLKIVGTLALSAVGLLGMINASAAESYKFTLYNNSQYPISGFQTYEDGKWSSWTGVKAGPGDSVAMDWQSDSGDCTVPFRIIYRDVETEQYTVDWCKISNVYVNDDSVTVD